MHPFVFLSAGLTAGLVTSVSLRFLWAQWAARDAEAGVWRRASALGEISYILSHCVLGAGLGWFYWLSWGLAGVVSVTWWQRGLLFGVLLTALFGGGLLMLLRSLFQLPAMVMRCWLIEVALLTTTVGLYCAWQWQSVI